MKPGKRDWSSSRHNSGLPHTFPRRILLAVTGLSPQVVTETVYALTCRTEPAFVPTEIHLLTTANGAERAELTLLSENPGWFRRLRSDYKLPEIRFGAADIHALKATDGVPIADIRTREENERLADVLTHVIREFTAVDDCALHVSIAGGRKTMGFYAGYALSLFGRPQDRLSHVLVSEPYESNLDFYYPTPGPSVIYTKNNDPLDASKAEVNLAEIPFVRLRPKPDSRLLKGSITFSQAVAAAQKALDHPPSIEIDFDRKVIVAGGQEVRLPPAQLAFIGWMARRAESGRPDVEYPTDGYPNGDYAREYLQEYAHLGDDDKSETAKKLKDGMARSFFDQTKSRLHKNLEESLGPDGPRMYGIRDNGRRPRLFRIAVSGENIRWAGGLDRVQRRPASRKLAKSASKA